MGTIDRFDCWIRGTNTFTNPDDPYEPFVDFLNEHLVGRFHVSKIGREADNFESDTEETPGQKICIYSQDYNSEEKPIIKFGFRAKDASSNDHRSLSLSFNTINVDVDYSPYTTTNQQYPLYGFSTQYGLYIVIGYPLYTSSTPHYYASGLWFIIITGNQNNDICCGVTKLSKQYSDSRSLNMHSYFDDSTNSFVAPSSSDNHSVPQFDFVQMLPVITSGTFETPSYTPHFYYILRGPSAFFDFRNYSQEWDKEKIITIDNKQYLCNNAIALEI